MEKNNRKHYTSVINRLLPLVYKYPYNHHKPLPADCIKAINEFVNQLK